MNTYQIEWKDVSIPCIKDNKDGAAGHYTVPGKAAGDTGIGYSIFNPQDDAPDDMPLYGIVQVATGQRIVHRDPILIEDLAKRVVAAIVNLNHDWNRGIEEIEADPQTAEVVKQSHTLYCDLTQKYYEILELAREETYWGE
jgi:hypothetical protein